MTEPNSALSPASALPYSLDYAPPDFIDPVIEIRRGTGFDACGSYPRVVSTKAHPNPYQKGDVEMAWTQPVTP